MSEAPTTIQRNALRTILVTLVVYAIVTTIAISRASNPFLNVAVVNLIHGGLLIGLMEKHSSRTGLEYLLYPFAILAPALSGVLFYHRHSDLS